MKLRYVDFLMGTHLANKWDTYDPSDYLGHTQDIWGFDSYYPGGEKVILRPKELAAFLEVRD